MTPRNKKKNNNPILQPQQHVELLRVREPLTLEKSHEYNIICVLCYIPCQKGRKASYHCQITSHLALPASLPGSPLCLLLPEVNVNKYCKIWNPIAQIPVCYKNLPVTNVSNLEFHSCTNSWARANWESIFFFKEHPSKTNNKIILTNIKQVYLCIPLA